MIINGTLEKRGLSVKGTNAIRRDEQIARLRLYELGLASLSTEEITKVSALPVAEPPQEAETLPTNITQSRMTQLMIAAMML